MTDEPQQVFHVAANMKKLRWINLNNSTQLVATTYPKVIMPGSFPPRELCCLTLEDINAKQLWEGSTKLENDQTEEPAEPDEDTRF
uniref:Uncharacterized protein n=1 Tax=Lactuca sativa TaxID=4236 RepID=A0A9R1WWW1_LACSA|nr:hypothetical protein LSAT_V11C800408390 [Lactuca sativa]